MEPVIIIHLFLFLRLSLLLFLLRFWIGMFYFCFCFCGAGQWIPQHWYVWNLAPVGNLTSHWHPTSLFFYLFLFIFSIFSYSFLLWRLTSQNSYSQTCLSSSATQLAVPWWNEMLQKKVLDVQNFFWTSKVFLDYFKRIIGRPKKMLKNCTDDLDLGSCCGLHPCQPEIVTCATR